MLTANNVRKEFGGLVAVNGVTLTVERGERHAIIGPNGAGKSTFFNLLAGELPVTSGQVILDGRDVTRLPVYQRANLGLGHTFQRNNLFAGLTAFENVRLAVQHQKRVNHRWFRPVNAFTDVEAAAGDALARVGLSHRQDAIVDELAYGQQRAVEIALALAAEPAVLLLDEPTAGMSPAETKEMADLIAQLPRELTIMIVEHDMDVIFRLADRITVLHYGEIIASGLPDEVRENRAVQEIYLGDFQ